MYNGRLAVGDSVFNCRLKKNEKVSKLFLAFADELKAVSSVQAGQIAVLCGLKQTSTGEVLVSPDLKNDVDDNFLPPTMKIPDPVLYATVEAASVSHEKALEQALTNIAREDPSLRVTLGSGEGFHENTDQIVMAGMGELHLEVIMDRIKREYKVDADLGQLMVAYRETVSQTVRDIFTFERTVFDRKMKVEIDLSVQPSPKSEPKLKVHLAGNMPSQITTLRPLHRKALERGFANAIGSGPLLGCPMIDLTCTVHDIEIGGQNLSLATDTIVSAAMTEAFKHACRKSELLEPVMRLDITSDEEHIHGIIQNLLVHRRGELLIDINEENSMANATVLAPLSELRGYSTYIRSVASGRAFFGMEFSHFAAMSETAQREAVAEVTGF